MADERRLKLNGEAYLEVAHLDNKPFFVETSNMEVKLLVTRFNINAYDDTQSVVLVEVSVSVVDKIGAEVYSIIPNQMFVSDSSTNTCSIETVNTYDYTSWLDCIFQFRNTSLDRVFKQLQRYYDVRINCDNAELQRITVSGKLQTGLGLDNALYILQQLSDISYNRTADGQIYITHK